MQFTLKVFLELLSISNAQVPLLNNPRNINVLLGEGSPGVSIGTSSRFYFSQLAGNLAAAHVVRAYHQNDDE